MSVRKKKRVWCLYRVSTLGQVDHDDIPMQHDQCHSFVQGRPDWEITNELYEKGVSGFKKKASEREALVTIQQAAQLKEFDVLLVFMFDRIGRRTDETPVIIKLLVDSGIEVWSTREGQRTYERDEDELIGWLGTWMSACESRRIALRVSASKSTMAARGCYSGGYVPFGYDAIRAGRVNKKDNPVRDLFINEDEAVIVQFIFNAIVVSGHGTHTIARALNAKGIKTKRGTSQWRATAIRAIARNPIYTGRMKTLDGLSAPFENLRIIDDELFDSAEQAIVNRIPVRRDDRHGSSRSIDGPRALLTGIIFCKSCGSRLAFNHSVRRKTLKSGEIRDYPSDYYRCYKKLDAPEQCTGKAFFNAPRVEETVLEVVRGFFDSVKKKPKAEMLRAAMSSESNVLDMAIKRAQRTFEQAKRAYDMIQDEAIKALTGDGAYTTEMINVLMPKQKAALDEAQAEYERLSKERNQEMKRRSAHTSQIKKMQTWADSFDSQDTDEKRQIIASVVEKVIVGDDYKVQVVFNITAAQYLGGDDVGDASQVHQDQIHLPDR